MYAFLSNNSIISSPQCAVFAWHPGWLCSFHIIKNGRVPASGADRTALTEGKNNPTLLSKHLWVVVMLRGIRVAWAQSVGNKVTQQVVKIPPITTESAFAGGECNGRFWAFYCRKSCRCTVACAVVGGSLSTGSWGMSGQSRGWAAYARERGGF